MTGIVLFIGLVLVLWVGRTIFIQLFTAAFFWYLINAIAAYYRKVMPFRRSKNRALSALTRVFDWTSNILSVVTLGGFMYLFAMQIRPMISELLSSLPEIQIRLGQFIEYIGDKFGVTMGADMLPDLAQFAAQIGASTLSIISISFMILIYMIFMFVEQSTFDRKISVMFRHRRKYKKLRYILDCIDDNMKKYLFMKTLVCAALGIISYMWMQFIGLEFAGVWAFVFFIATYVPTIGGIISCGLPIIYSLIVAPTMQLPILTAGGLVTLYLFFANILEPKLIGKSLNLSTLAILINLMFWGLIWGPMGMFFSVPLLVIIYVAASQFDSTRWLAVLLSADGNIPEKREEE